MNKNKRSIRYIKYTPDFRFNNSIYFIDFKRKQSLFKKIKSYIINFILKYF
jgi:hypothetical protein